MPSERFYRLSKEKQMAIWKASMQEFASVPYEKVSINKIIRSAGISRGSFYTYFEDKRDLWSFLLEDTSAKWKEFCLDRLDKTDGDVFSMMEALMDYAIYFCKNNDLFNVHKNLIIYPDDEMLGYISEKIDMEKTIGEEFYRKIDRSKLRDNSVGGVMLLMRLCMISMLAGIAEYHKNPEREKMIKKEYKKALLLFRYGAYKALEKDQVEDKVNE